MAAQPIRRYPGRAVVNIWTTPEREQLRKTVRSFAEREILPHVDEWERSGDLPRALHSRHFGKSREHKAEQFLVQYVPPR